jgi:hypothetical protein
MGAEPRPAVLAARRGHAAVPATRLVTQAALATCVLIGALPSLAQSTSAERDAPFCDDLKRLMRAADAGFAPFIKEPNENDAKSAQVLHYWAVPVKGFASARIAQVTRRTAGDGRKAALYDAQYEHRTPKPHERNSAAVQHPASEVENRVARCLNQPITRDVYGALFRADRMEIAVRHSPYRSVGAGVVTLEVGSPTLCPSELKEVRGCR